MAAETRPRTVARDNLSREAPFTLLRAEGDEPGDGLTLDGYGAVFDQVTEIDSWEGTFEEVIARGSFKKSLREMTPKVQFDHGRHPLIGSIPIGRITEIGEDDRGLHVVARLTDNWLIQPVRDAIADEAVDGMSFRFSIVREEWRDAAGKVIKAEDVDKALWYPSALGYDVVSPLRRTLKEVKCAEVGPVVWPAYDATSVGVRSVTIDLGDPRQLRDPETRKSLARAVYMADAAEDDATTSSTRTTDAPPAHQEPADEHPSRSTSSDDAPPVTDASPDEHPSAQPLSRSAAEAARAFAANAQGYLLSIEERN
jgi:HK97 family phage prohead protease